jgi:hypothetical protein
MAVSERVIITILGIIGCSGFTAGALVVTIIFFAGTGIPETGVLRSQDATPRKHQATYVQMSTAAALPMWQAPRVAPSHTQRYWAARQGKSADELGLRPLK